MIHLKYKCKVNFVKLPLIWTDLCLKLVSENATAGRKTGCRSVVNCALRFASSSFRWLFQMRFFLGVQNATKHCISRYHRLTVNTALLLIDKKNVHLKLKRDRGGFHEINLNLEDSMVNITTFSLNWKQMGNGFFKYFRMDIDTFTYMLGKIEDKALHRRHTLNTMYHMIYDIIL